MNRRVKPIKRQNSYTINPIFTTSFSQKWTFKVTRDIFGFKVFKLDARRKMKFEVVIEGEPRAISKLRLKLKPILPATENGFRPPNESNDKARMVLVETRESLPFTLLKISRIISKLNKNRLLKADLDLRVRNLAYSEPTVESHLLKKPFKPIPSVTIQIWGPSLPPATDEETIKIYPHHSFGTGKHPTTRLCLMYLDDMTQNPSREWSLRGREVLDFGCGTGVLAITAVKMGAKKAVGVEIDHQSAQTAMKNVELNGLSKRIHIKEGSWEVVEGKYDLILANLVTAALFRAGKHLPHLVEDHGRVVISGFSTNQQGEIEESFKKWGLVATDRSTLEGWSAMVLVKKGSVTF
jgi:ribosomal protein L11 methyltransferase